MHCTEGNRSIVLQSVFPNRSQQYVILCATKGEEILVRKPLESHLPSHSTPAVMRLMDSDNSQQYHWVQFSKLTVDLLIVTLHLYFLSPFTHIIHYL